MALSEERYQQLKKKCHDSYSSGVVNIYKTNEVNHRAPRRAGNESQKCKNDSKRYIIKSILKNHHIEMDSKEDESQLIGDSIESLRREAQMVLEMNQRNDSDSTGMYDTILMYTRNKQKRKKQTIEQTN